MLRNQFHDVLAGTAIAAAYGDALHDYERAERIVDRVAASARSILPRSDVAPVPGRRSRRSEGEEFVFANDYVRARVRPRWDDRRLAGVAGRNLAAIANGLMLYVDRPRRWDAWNLDASYDRRPRKLRRRGARRGRRR